MPLISVKKSLFIKKKRPSCLPMKFCMLKKIKIKFKTDMSNVGLYVYMSFPHSLCLSRYLWQLCLKPPQSISSTKTKQYVTQCVSL